MSDLRSAVQSKMPLTMGETIALAKEFNTRVVDVVLTESRGTAEPRHGRV